MQTIASSFFRSALPVICALPAFVAVVATAGVAHAQNDGRVTFGGSATPSGVTTNSSATTPTAAPAATEPATDQEKEWAERDRKINEANTLTGPMGLLHFQYAQSG